jgi:predicted MPP superfamily phosphohydrolase
MLRLTRRRLLTAVGAAGGALIGYAVGYEPMLALTVVRYDLALPGWPADAPPLTAALVADIHAVEPWMPARRVGAIVEATNALGADVVLLLGDYVGTMRFKLAPVAPADWARELARLRAPLGVFGILGNHEYRWPEGPEPLIAALGSAGVTVLINDAALVAGGGHRFWLAGTDSARSPARPGVPPGVVGGGDDYAGAMAATDASAPVLALIHEPFQFPRVDARPVLTLCGHTHGGQLNLPFIGRPFRDPEDPVHVYGLYREADGRQLLVSGGLGCSIAPVRFRAPPEIVLVRISGRAA